MKRNDIKIWWNDTPYETVSKLLSLLEDGNLIAQDIQFVLPKDIEAESVFLTESQIGGREKEWQIHGGNEEIEGDFRVESFPDDTLKLMAKTLMAHLGIQMTDKQKLINNMFSSMFPMLMEEHELIVLPCDELSYIDDIDKVLDGECDGEDYASEHYGNGDWYLMELYEEKAKLQMAVLEEAFGKFVELIEDEEDENA